MRGVGGRVGGTEIISRIKSRDGMHNASTETTVCALKDSRNRRVDRRKERRQGCG